MFRIEMSIRNVGRRQGEPHRSHWEDATDGMLFTEKDANILLKEWQDETDFCRYRKVFVGVWT